MGYENVKCNKCGKSYRVQMYGKQSGRDYRVANWLGMCDECNEAGRNANGWSGSAKQIEWATQIKADMIKKFEKYDLNECGQQVKTLLEDNCDAKFWIDSRYQPFESLIEQVAKANGLL